MYISSGKQLVEVCNEKKLPIGEFAIQNEMEESGLSREKVIEKMRKNLKTMKVSASNGLEKEIISVSGLIGGDAKRLNDYAKNQKSLSGGVMVTAMARALSCSEVNASMGRIVACPTAGSCGIIPAVITTVGEALGKSDDELIEALFCSSAVGIIIAQNACVAGAEGGCQAECGSAAAMACAAVIELMGGTPAMCLNGAAIVIKNILGLVCDPIAGLVEVPCAKRNASGAVSAITVADMVMAGIVSKIPFDDVVSAMYKVGKALPAELRETALGGLAATPTGIELRKQILGE